MKHDLQQEAIFEMLSELKEKLDTLTKEVSASTPAREITTNEELEKYIVHISKQINSGHNKLVDGINSLSRNSVQLANILKQQPKVKEWTPEEILDLLPKPRTVTIWGLEFVRTNFIIFILFHLLVLSIALNLKFFLY
ncbi:MAG: hypothetical protein LUF85_11265 [Bacteroides sp.]|nr:hypothetical protein [Bacteroides sp.]